MKRKIEQNEKMNILRLYTSGHSCKTIAQMYQCSPTCINQFLHQNQCQMREATTRINDMKINENYFCVIDTESKAYLLGYLWADGYISKNGYYLCLALALKDEQIIDFLINQLYPEKFPTKNYRRHPKLSVSVTVSSKKLCKNLLELGFKEKQVIPNNIHANILHHFLRGVFDGDGCITFKKNSPMVYFLGEKSFLEVIQKYLIEKLNLNRTKIIDVGNIYRLSFSSIKDCYKIFNYIYKDCTIYLKRKQIKFDTYYQKKNIEQILQKHKSSKYKYIIYEKSRQKWRVAINSKYIGRYNSEEEAFKVLIERTS